MTPELYNACNEMTKAVGYVSWDNLPTTVRVEVMQLTLLHAIATQLEEIDRSLGSSR